MSTPSLTQQKIPRNPPFLKRIPSNPPTTPIHPFHNPLIMKKSNNHNRPTWTELNSDNNKCHEIKESPAVIATNPESAWELYRDKQLWTDFNISEGSVRVAFRYVDESTSQDDEGSNGKEETAIHLCWINSNGVPVHFYRLYPSDEECEVNEDDHIETTYAGHGFVFCKRLDEGCVEQILKRIEDRSGDVNVIVKSDGIVVLNFECGVVFLRRRKGDESGSEDESEEDGSERLDDDNCSEKEEGQGNDDSDVNNEDQDSQKEKLNEESMQPLHLEGDWEAFLVVGGFRLGTNGTSSSDSQEGNGDKEAKENKDKQADSIEAEQNGKSSSEVRDVADAQTDEEIEVGATDEDKDSENSSDDEDDDEWSMQLITLYQSTIPFPSEKDESSTQPSLRGSQKNHDEALRPSDHSLFKHNQFLLTAQLTKLDSTPINTVDKHYNTETIGGWPCKVEPGSLSCHKLHERISNDLSAACQHLPPQALEKLKRSTPIWINKTLSYGPKVAPIREANMCFHPGSEWLVRNGMNPAKKGGVELYRSGSYLDDCHLWGEGGLMLHELSHAWHCLHCDEGYDNPIIQKCYEQAMEDKLYDCVEFHCGDGGKKDSRKAYACTNAMEYFAELSAAFLGGLDDREYNKWYPFNRRQIREHDPRAFDMLCQMWGVVDDEYGKV